MGEVDNSEESMSRLVTERSGYLAAARQFPNATLVAIDTDPLATLMLRANAAVREIGHRLTVYCSDYRDLKLLDIASPTLFIGNPPYVRRHNISEDDQTWFAETTEIFGFKANKLASLHIHFFLKTRQLARPGDIGAFITSSEWLDVNYGSVLRSLLADGLGGSEQHVLSAESMPFAAATTGAITCFRVGRRPASITMPEERCRRRGEYKKPG